MLTSITNELDKSCPITKSKIKNYRPDWMIADLLDRIKDRDYFYTKAKRTGDRGNHGWLATLHYVSGARL